MGSSLSPDFKSVRLLMSVSACSRMSLISKVCGFPHIL